MTEPTTKSKGGSDNGFPVELTKGFIKNRILTDLPYALECLVVVYESQTKTEKTYESSGAPSKERNGAGFMSSHAVRGSVLARKVQAEEDLSKDEQKEAQKLVSHYTRQLARRAREQAPASVKKELAPFFNNGPKPAAKKPAAKKTTKTVKAPTKRTRSAAKTVKAPTKRTRAKKTPVKAEKAA